MLEVINTETFAAESADEAQKAEAATFSDEFVQTLTKWYVELRNRQVACFGGEWQQLRPKIGEVCLSIDRLIDEVERQAKVLEQ